jgi:Family of unknown function (DUF6241)
VEKNWLKYLILIVITSLISISATLWYVNINNSENTEDNTPNVENEESSSNENNETYSKVESIVDYDNLGENDLQSDMLDQWKSGDDPFIENLFQEILQQMTHQKVISDTKEGSILMTQDRIEKLILMLEENEAAFEYSDQYMKILQRWSDGNFSLVDNDHNEVWRLQGTKTTGLATGIASKEQEQDYIFKVFDIPLEKQK